MNDLEQTESYLRAALAVVEDAISDLENWSVINKDRNLDEIVELKKKFEETRKAINDR